MNETQEDSQEESLEDFFREQETIWSLFLKEEESEGIIRPIGMRTPERILQIARTRLQNAKRALEEIQEWKSRWW